MHLGIKRIFTYIYVTFYDKTKHNALTTDSELRPLLSTTTFEFCPLLKNILVFWRASGTICDGTLRIKFLVSVPVLYTDTSFLEKGKGCMLHAILSSLLTFLYYDPYLILQLQLFLYLHYVIVYH